MTEPNTVNKGLIIPNTGDLPGTWGSAALNPDLSAVDGMLGGVATVSLTNTPVTLTAPSGTITPGIGPNQSQNAVIVFTGTLSGNVTVTFPLPGFYIVKNACVVGAFYVQAKSGAGNVIGLPPGQPTHIYSDGTNVDFVDLPPPGSYWDWSGGTVPAWIGACTKIPWHACDGTVVNVSDWPVLFSIIAGSYGGNGISTFGLPDFRNRVMVPIDINQGGFSNRVTTAGSGINGQLLGAAGGDQLAQQHTHTYTEPNSGQGHAHTAGSAPFLLSSPGNLYDSTSVNSGTSASQTNFSTTGITINNFGSGAGQNMQPALVGGIRFIRMG